MKKMIIFTVSTGGGHNQAALSLQEVIQQNGYEVIILDALKETNNKIDLLVSNGYEVLVKRFPKTYRELYKISNKEKINSSMRELIEKLIQEKIYELICDYKPNIIIGTHPFLVHVIAELKRKKLINIPFISIVTDFKVHQTYIHKSVDAYITGSYYTKLGIIDKGISEEKIFNYGIPIRKEFLLNKNEIKRDSQDIRTILVMGGSMGMKSMKKVIKKLVNCKNKFKIIVVCGKDKALKHKIKEKYEDKIKNEEMIVYGFVKNISELMDMSDIIITKPGGLTVSECIARNIPMIMPYTIPGQEEENAEFLVQSGAAIRVEKISNITKTVDGIIGNPKKLIKMRKNIEELSKNYSSDAIVELVDRLVNDNEVIINEYDKVELSI